jgi:glycosyltransferase involved in cell wall biosynthesis
MTKKIIFLNTIHYSLDDRVFYHQAKSLVSNGFQVFITSTKEELTTSIDGIIISSYKDDLLTQRQKQTKIVEQLNKIKPDIVVCDSPMSVLAACIYRKKLAVKVIYDVTEWYPSKKNFPDTKGIKKWLKSIILIVFNLLAGLKTNSFIFGEYYKSIAFRSFLFWKPFIFLPYYPDLNYIKHYPLKLNKGEMNFLYTGVINADKGIDSVIHAIQLTAKKFTNIKFNLKIIGYFAVEKDRSYFEEICSSLESNISIEQHNFMPFPEFCQVIGDTDLFFDLRKRDFENTHCLPIKLFYYLACGRPVIYSNLRAIRKEIADFNFGKLVSPNDSKSISNYIETCLLDEKFYNLQCKNALNSSKGKYNWELIEKQFITHIQSSLGR